MPHLALYRKYRSQTFGDLIGQSHVTKTLQNAIAKGKISHSYLFTGPRGTGKTSTARLLAKALNCEKGPAAEPCNECQACREITAGNCLDVVEMDAASESGVDDIRESIVEAVEYRPAYCRFRVFIIDEVHDLSRQAFDALLKTVEEPPDHVVFILATTEFSKVPPTVRSRCQRYEFHRGSIQDLVSRMKHVVEAEGAQAEPAALTAIARMSDGGFRDSLTLLEQAILTTDGVITLQNVYDQLGLVSDEIIDRLLSQLAGQDIPGLMSSLEEVYRLGRDPRSVVESVLYRLAELTRAAYGIETNGLDDAAQEAGLKATAGALGMDKILTFRAAMAEAHHIIRDVSIPRVWLEAELVRVAQGPRQVAPKQVEPARPQPQAQSQPQHKAEPPKPTVPTATAPQAPVVEKTPEPPVVAVEESDDPHLTEARMAYVAVVNDLAQRSPVARERLSNSRVDRIEHGTAYIQVRSQMVLDQIVGRPIEKGIREAWSTRGLKDLTLAFFAGARPAQVQTVVVEETAVELPAEGERLVEMAREVFGTGGQTSS